MLEKNKEIVFSLCKDIFQEYGELLFIHPKGIFPEQKRNKEPDSLSSYATILCDEELFRARAQDAGGKPFGRVLSTAVLWSEA